MAAPADKHPSPSHYDIVIVGAGPVGLMLSTCLARWGYKIKHIDNRAEPTPTGRADGIQPRSLDLLRNMGLKSAIMAHKPARVYEVAFWDPSSSSSGSGEAGQGKGRGIVRTGTWASCPGFIDARYPFTTLLHQGRIERVFIADLGKSGVTIQRPWTISGFASDENADPNYPVTVNLEHVDGTAKETVKAKYLFGGEGARSFIRNQLGIGIKHKDPIAHVWGVMDGVVKTDFPDIKMKCTIHSEHGSIMVIPREDNMVRLYIQIASSTDPDFSPRKTATAEQVQASAKRILQPYSIEWERVEWYSVYPIGQGIADKYTLDHRVFLGGDACHTHSPKAGQGMNTAFLDALNLAWKIHAVESGFARRSLLETYETERKEVAESLLAFDNKYARLFSQRPPAASEVAAASAQTNGGTPGANNESSHKDNEFVNTFKESCAFTSGYGVSYQPNALNWSPSHPAQSHVILHPDSTDAKEPRRTRTRLIPGRLLPNADVTRVVDANVVHLEQEIPLNGSFRLFIFTGGPLTSTTTTSNPSPRRNRRHRALHDLAAHMSRRNSFYAAYSYTHHPQTHPNPPLTTPQAKNNTNPTTSTQTQTTTTPTTTVTTTTTTATTTDPAISHHEQHNPHSRFFTLCTVIAAPRADIDIARDLPPLMARYREHVYADDRILLLQGQSQNVGNSNAGDSSSNGSNDSNGAVVVVRPDGYVGIVVALEEGNATGDALDAYFGAFSSKPLGVGGQAML
ncbi:uncharacterized protein C8A04DRAFT_34903 [Dichotomopilus funicola]|uniref:Phenol 2-monooxygenase n=1 Tax=Dichotomopilus funicola TaxID=1934379 RepID=A0AAN6V8J5_9PEZI|nr:hypothetical protein C8A04DRAFT_34903 [Dichotomopilus funicola]